ncbi:kinase-like protein [Melanomma pulvis-pyrius CBS 109.77]|uniref:Kinase-like protein n=1 Tax=Melanomma pulvis-pyrius CBS 109.77 TaxID=1314802 RepID=A0A6A6XV71_9PLEO|nr:kinase-like protein [Melanomma pulvis-pyrius CBS 109.77]
MKELQNLPCSDSPESDPHITRLGASATSAYPGEDYSDYGLIAVLGLAQRLKIDLLPITWQAILGLAGQSRARIHQALVSVQTSFAFKRFDHNNQSDPLREIVQEMVILGHPVVQHHPHIVQLIGICWDIPSDTQHASKDGQDIYKGIPVWPVLVFEKSDLGHLYHFAQSSKGKGMSFEDRLNICVDVGIAIRDMHRNDIIHGDVKPQNVLMFEERPGIYNAKVADFGLSTYFHGEKDLVQIPQSVPWNAPEHHHRYFRPQDAKAMDVYSFGMLCLWLLFGVESFETMPYSSTAANVTEVFSFKAQDWSGREDLLLSWKSNRPLDWATKLVAEDGRLTAEIKERMTCFFQSSLRVDPDARVIDWQHLLGLLALAR